MDPLIIGMIVLDQYGALLIDHPADMKVCQEDHGLDTDWNFLYHPWRILILGQIRILILSPIRILILGQIRILILGPIRMLSVQI